MEARVEWEGPRLDEAGKGAGKPRFEWAVG